MKAPDRSPGFLSWIKMTPSSITARQALWWEDLTEWRGQPLSPRGREKEVEEKYVPIFPSPLLGLRIMSRSKESFSPYTTEHSRKITFQAALLTNLGHSCYHGGCTMQPCKSDPEVEISQAALDTHVVKTELLGSPAKKIARLKEGIGGCGSDRVTL